MGTDTVTGTISLDEASVLLLDIPYSIGWSAYVDGEMAELYQANGKTWRWCWTQGYTMWN